VPGRVAIFLSHADDDALRLAGSCAATSAAMGDRVDVFLFGPALAAVRAAAGEDEHAGSLLVQSRKLGTVRFVACSASLVEARIDLLEAERAFDAVVGWPTIVEWSRGVVDRFFF
jgi:peroxiredoxin family protein